MKTEHTDRSEGPKSITAKTLHSIFTELWPMLSTKAVGIVIDSTDWREDALGFHLHEPGNVESYVEFLASGHPAREFIGSSQLAHIIVIDAAKCMAEGGSGNVVLTGLHEFAHAIRTELADGLYPNFHTLKKVSEYLENRLGETMGTDEAPPACLLVTDDLMSDVDYHLFERDGAGNKPLFGDWVVRTFQHDGGHDLLFYLILYKLERDATDRGLIRDGDVVVRSVYLPGRVDAVISTPSRY